MTVADVDGVVIAGRHLRRGPTNSPVLLQIGPARPNGKSGGRRSDPHDPTALHDVFFRIGGPHVGKATVSLEVNSDDVILDHIWAWRADHGSRRRLDGQHRRHGRRRQRRPRRSRTGLFAEHYQHHNVIWNGENGKTIFFQNELPYDPPNQAAWQHGGVLGWAAYKVADSVKTHEGWGLGSYCFLNVDPSIHTTPAFEVPVTPGVKLHGILSLSITNHGDIDHVVNDTGPATDANTTPVNLVSFP